MWRVGVQYGLSFRGQTPDMKGMFPFTTHPGSYIQGILMHCKEDTISLSFKSSLVGIYKMLGKKAFVVINDVFDLAGKS